MRSARGRPRAGPCGARSGCGGGARGSVGRGHREARLALLDPLALVEARARLEGEAEVAHGPVEGGGARVHFEDREDVAVALDEGDVERRRDVLHVELAVDLAPEIE